MIASMLALALAAQPSWRCTYRGFNTQSSVSSEFRRIGGNLVDQWDLVYVIVQDDESGLAAALSSTYRDQVEASIIVINKKTGGFNRATISAPASGEPQETAGHCVIF